MSYSLLAQLSIFMTSEYQSEYNHSERKNLSSLIREVVFGVEDGMVSTVGVITGIAAGTQDHFTVILAGLVIIAVESISMGVGSFLSSKSEKEILEKKMAEEKIEIEKNLLGEIRELRDMYVHDGWPQDLAGSMAEEASKNQDLFLKEMAFRELKIIPDEFEIPWKNGLYMGISYILGGSIPLLPYLFLASLEDALVLSLLSALIGLFLLGAFITKFTGRIWWKSGIEMALFAGAAAVVGYLIGKIASSLSL